MVECVRFVAPEGRYRSGACMPHSWTARRGLDSNSMISGAYRRNSKIRCSSSNRPTSSENASDDGKIVSKTKCVGCHVSRFWTHGCILCVFCGVGVDRRSRRSITKNGND